MGGPILTPAAVQARALQLDRAFREFLRPKASHELTARLIYEDPQGSLRGRTRRPTGEVDADGQPVLREVTVRLSQVTVPLGHPPTAEAVLYGATDRFLRQESKRTGRQLAELEAEIDPELLADVRALHAFETMQRVAPAAAREALVRAGGGR